MKDHKYMTPKEAALQAGVTRQTVCRWCAAGKVDAFRINAGGVWWINRDKFALRFPKDSNLEHLEHLDQKSA